MDEKIVRKITIVVVLIVIFMFSGIAMSYAMINCSTDETIEEKDLNEVKEDVRPDLTQYYSDYTKYKDIRLLDKNYDLQSAIQDGCFVIDGSKMYNDGNYSEFISNKAERQNAALRVVGFTEDGGKVLYDIKYNPIEDNSRIIYYDFDTNADDAVITTYDHVEEYEYENHSYFVAYDGNEMNWETATTIAVIF